MSQKKSVASTMSNNSAQIGVENVTSRFSVSNFMSCSTSVVIIVAVLVGLGSCAIMQDIVEEGQAFVRRFSQTPMNEILTGPKNLQFSTVKNLAKFECVLVTTSPSFFSST